MLYYAKKKNHFECERVCCNLEILLVMIFLVVSVQVVKDAIASGVDGYDADVKLAVRKAAHGLRLSRDAAMSIASKAVSIHFDCFFLLLSFM